MKSDRRAAEVRAFEAVTTAKFGTWESVESAAILALACPSNPESRRLLAAAGTAAEGLKAGTWESVRALAWLAKAHRELG